MFFITLCSAFSAAYARGSIPCHINHGSVNSTLTWSTSPAGVFVSKLHIEIRNRT